MVQRDLLLCAPRCIVKKCIQPGLTPPRLRAYRGQGMNLALSVALTATLALSSLSQEVPINTAPTGKPSQQIEVEVAAPRPPKSSEISTNALSKPQPPDQPTKPKRTYSGLAHDLRKSTNRWKIFSLRRPANLKEDDANVTREGLRTEAGGAIKLISVDF